MKLIDIFENNTDLPINKWLHYFPIYERYFKDFVGKKFLFIEIGSGNGGSARMWKKYFGDQVRIVSLDIRPEVESFANENIYFRVGDQADKYFLDSVLEEFGTPTIVLDDGSHVQQHMIASLEHLYSSVRNGGLYMIEDTHTSYWANWNGGLRKSGTFIEEMKLIIDGLHADNPHNMYEGKEPNIPSPISCMTKAIHFYPSIVVLERGIPEKKFERSIPYIEGAKVY